MPRNSAFGTWARTLFAGAGKWIFECSQAEFSTSQSHMQKENEDNILSALKT